MVRSIKIDFKFFYFSNILDKVAKETFFFTSDKLSDNYLIIFQENSLNY